MYYTIITVPHHYHHHNQEEDSVLEPAGGKFISQWWNGMQKVRSIICREPCVEACCCCWFLCFWREHFLLDTISTTTIRHHMWCRYSMYRIQTRWWLRLLIDDMHHHLLLPQHILTGPTWWKDGGKERETRTCKRTIIVRNLPLREHCMQSLANPTIVHLQFEIKRERDAWSWKEERKEELYIK